MLLELCITELEDVAAELEQGGTSGVRSFNAINNMTPITQETSHPYTDEASGSGKIRIPGQYIHIVY